MSACLRLACLPADGQLRTLPVPSRLALPKPQAGLDGSWARHCLPKVERRLLACHASLRVGEGGEVVIASRFECKPAPRAHIHR